MSAQLSICVYGSFARGTCDDLSDRDVLIIGDSAEACETTARLWREGGWNVALFSTDRFESMARFGSLFVQHLKCEGLVVADNGFLRSTLDAFLPAASYREQLHHALEPIEWLDGKDDSYWRRLCLADILFVAIRNAAVTWQAMSGRPMFDFRSLINNLADECQLLPNEHQALLNLRMLKCAYRNRECSAEVASSWSDISVAARRLRDYMNSAQLLHVVDNNSVSDFRPNAYYALRQFELDLLRVHDPRVLDAAGPSDIYFDVWQLIRNPTAYDKLEQFGRGLPIGSRQHFRSMPIDS